MRIARAASIGGFLMCLLAIAGCADDKMAEVSGTVKFDGRPIKDGSILFIPNDGASPTTGGVIEDGEYFTRVPIGTMKVKISMAKVVGPKKLYNTPNSPEMNMTKEGLPDKYNEKSELQIEVQPGPNEKNFDLKSK